MNERMNSSATVARVRRRLVERAAIFAAGLGVAVSVLGVGCLAATGEPITGEAHQAQRAADAAGDAPAAEDSSRIPCGD